MNRKAASNKLERSKSSEIVTKITRKLFTVDEDHKILAVWRKEKEKKTMWYIAEKAAKQLDRTVDSVRDRIRRYIARMNEDEIRNMEHMYEVGRFLPRKIQKAQLCF